MNNTDHKLDPQSSTAPSTGRSYRCDSILTQASIDQLEPFRVGFRKKVGLDFKIVVSIMPTWYKSKYI